MSRAALIRQAKDVLQKANVDGEIISNVVTRLVLDKELTNDDIQLLLDAPTPAQRLLGVLRRPETRAWGHIAVPAVTGRLTAEQVAAALDSLYRCHFDAEVAAAEQSRQGPLQAIKEKASNATAIPAIGSHFILKHYEAPTLSLLRALKRMHLTFTSMDQLVRFRDHLQLLRIVSSPGMGKTAALSALWQAVHKLVVSSPTHELVASLPADLKLRIQASCGTACNLVFVHDCSDIPELTDEEQSANSDTILALRLLFSSLRGLQPKNATAYKAFCKDMPPDLLNSIGAWDVLLFIQRAAGMAPCDPCIIVMGFDEVNSARPTPGSRNTWTQLVLSSFVRLREAAAHWQHDGRAAILPIAVAASTRASAASLRDTASHDSRVKDIVLQPLSQEEAEAVALDILRRLPNAPAGVQLPAGLSDMLQWVGGNPRLLAQTLSALSGASSLLTETVCLGSTSVPQWLLEPVNVGELAGRVIAHMLHGRWAAWVGDDDQKTSILDAAVAHSLLEVKVARDAKVLRGSCVTWEQLEGDGIVTLVEAEERQERPSLDSGETELAGPNGATQQADGGASTSAAADFDELVARAEEEKVAQEGVVKPDTRPTQLVSIPPLLLIAAHSIMSSQDWVPLLSVNKWAHTWRPREYSDCSILALRLQMFKQLGRDTLLLKDLYKGLADTEYENIRVRVPETGYEASLEHPSLTDSAFARQVKQANAGQGPWLWVGNGQAPRPDSWIILQCADEPEPVVLMLQSKLSADPTTSVTLRQLSIEAGKCWRRPPSIVYLLMLVTDRPAENPQLYDQGLDLSPATVLIARDKHVDYYGSQVHLIKQAMQAGELASSAQRKQPRKVPQQQPQQQQQQQQQQPAAAERCQTRSQTGALQMVPQQHKQHRRAASGTPQKPGVAKKQKKGG